MLDFTREELESVGFNIPPKLDEFWNADVPVTLSVIFEFNGSLGNAIWLLAKMGRGDLLTAMCEEALARADASAAKAQADVEGGFLNAAALPHIEEFRQATHAAMNDLLVAEDETALRHAAIQVCARVRTTLAAGQVAYTVDADAVELSAQKQALVRLTA